ncbi:MAG: nucleoside hydrolase [Terracidiphilus sp.]
MKISQLMPSAALLALAALIASAACKNPASTPGQSATETQAAVSAEPQLAILDTDIGDDIDDAFALALVLRSPELHLLGITTAYGDTELRARLLDRYLAAVGRTDIPVETGVATPHTNVFTQAAYASQPPSGTNLQKHPDAVQFLLDQIRAHPGQITLIAIGPLFNVQAAIERDPATFHQLKRVVLMGGSIHRGYDNILNGMVPVILRSPSSEWNINRDPAGARVLLASGVPVFMMPLDSTQIHLQAHDRDTIFTHGSPLTEQLKILYHQWVDGSAGHPDTPTLFDPVAVAYAIRPQLCPATPMHLEVDDKGFTRPVDGSPNAQVCLQSDEKVFLTFLLGRITADPAATTPVTPVLMH